MENVVEAKKVFETRTGAKVVRQCKLAEGIWWFEGENKKKQAPKRGMIVDFRLNSDLQGFKGYAMSEEEVKEWGNTEYGWYPMFQNFPLDSPFLYVVWKMPKLIIKIGKALNVEVTNGKEYGDRMLGYAETYVRELERHGVKIGEKGSMRELTEWYYKNKWSSAVSDGVAEFTRR